MCTSTLEPAIPKGWPQLERVMVLLTAAPMSGIGTSVPLVSLHPGGGGVGAAPMNSSRLGELAPALFTTPTVALFTIVSRTCCGVKLGFWATIKAATPVTCGAAIEVPLSDRVAVSSVRYDERMFTPGANRSTQVPTLENDARLSPMSVAPTVIAAGTR